MSRITGDQYDVIARKVPCTSSGVAPILSTPTPATAFPDHQKAQQVFLSPEDIDRAAEDLKNASLLFCNWSSAWEQFITPIEIWQKHGVEVLSNPAPALRDEYVLCL